MSDEQGQEKPRFEPPPWEREAFEALAARRAEEEAVQAILDAEKADRAAARAADEVVVVSAAAPAAPVVAEPVAAAAVAAPVAQAPRSAGSVNDKQVQAMMLQLQREEYTDGKSAKFVGWAASGITIALGVSMLVTGLRMASGSGGKSLAVMGSAVLSIFGLCFIGMSVWVWVRTTRLKGR